MFSYPLNNSDILKRAKFYKRELLNDGTTRLRKNIMVLGGSTTNDIVRMLELFLLDKGIEANFYQSEYAQYWQDAMFPSEELLEFKPDIIFIHTTSHNITWYPDVKSSAAQTQEKLDEQYAHFEVMWDKLRETYHCPIIQNNFEPPFYRLLGNSDCYDFHGRTNYVSRLNALFYEYAREHQGFYIHDIAFLAACYGLERWSNQLYWHMYKYAMEIQAIPEFSFNLANIIKSIFGKNKKVLALDLDNTLWGGIVGDDGVENLALGHEIPLGEVFSEFQQYIKMHKTLGVLLAVCSKNDHENALAGLNHPDSVLSPEDFISIKANWLSKDVNICDIATQLNVFPEAVVLVDDNPAEREIVRSQLPGVEAPEMNNVEEYIKVMDRNGFFEATSISDDDLNRNVMYQQNALRTELKSRYADYGEFLQSLEMEAVIRDFEPVDIQRITQLTNKSNQFNLTTKRYTPDEMEQTAKKESLIRLCGRLGDKFGDNGIVSVVIGEIRSSATGKNSKKALHIELWLMSCRVLKREMEYAMLDALVEECRRRKISTIYGYYIPSGKNSMVERLYEELGFSPLSGEGTPLATWRLEIKEHVQKNKFIKVKKSTKG